MKWWMKLNRKDSEVIIKVYFEKACD